MGKEQQLTPLMPSTFFKFLSQSKLDCKSLECVMAAIVRYHESCSKAALQMQKDIDVCLNKKPPVLLKARKPVAKTKAVTKRRKV